MKIYNHVFVWLVIALPLLIHAFPKANKFDLVERFLPVMVVGFLIVVGCLKGWAFSYWKRRKSAEPKFAGPPKLLLIPLILFVAWSALSFAFAEVSTFGLTEIYMLFTGALMFLYFSTTQLVAHKNKKEDLKISFLEHYLPLGLTILLTLSLLGGIYGFLSTDHTRFFGLFYNPEIKADAWPNAYALFFLLTFPLTLYWMWVQKRSQNHVYSVLKIILIGLLLGGFILTFSRAGMLAFIIEMAFLGLFLLHKLKPFNDIKAWHIIMIAVLIGAISYGTLQGLQNLKSQNGDTTDISDRVTFQEVQGGSSFTERKEFFAGSVELIKERPLIGYGPASFKWTYPHVQKGFLSLSDHPHNLLFKYATERGLPTVIFFLTFLLALFIKTNPFSRNSTTFQRFVWAALLGALAHSMVDHNLNFISNYLIFWLLLSALAASISQQKTSKYTHYTSAVFALILIAILTCSSICLVKNTWDYHYLKLTAHSKFTEFKSVADYDPMLPRWTFFRIDDVIAERTQFQPIDQIQDALADRRLLMGKQLASNPYDAIAYDRLGMMAYSEGRTKNAFDYYAKAIEVNPKNTFRYYASYVRTAIELNDQEAIEKIRPILIQLIEEYLPLYEKNLHYTQRDNELMYVSELQELLSL